MTQDNNSKSTRFSWAKFFVNGKPVSVGEEITLYGGQDNKIQIQDTSGQVTQVRVGLAHSAGKIDAIPDFLEGVSPVDSFFSWLLKPEDNHSGTAALVFFTPDDVTTLEVNCKIEPNISFSFINLFNIPMLPPPAVHDIDIKFPIFPLVLLTSKGSPWSGVEVSFSAPEHESSRGETGSTGVAQGDLVRYANAGIRELQAVAALPTGNVLARVLVNFFH